MLAHVRDSVLYMRINERNLRFPTEQFCAPPQNLPSLEKVLVTKGLYSYREMLFISFMI